MIQAPPGDVRPATARLKQSLFDYLSGTLFDAMVLDLYCGSGALGLEAISRGAAQAHFVDQSQRAIGTARKNAESLGFLLQCGFSCFDVYKYLKKHTGESSDFDIVFAAPPYRIADPGRLLQAIEESGVMGKGGFVCIEYSRHNLEPKPDSYKLDRRKIYGETIIDVWDFAP